MLSPARAALVRGSGCGGRCWRPHAQRLAGCQEVSGRSSRRKHWWTSHQEGVHCLCVKHAGVVQCSGRVLLPGVLRYGGGRAVYRPHCHWALWCVARATATLFKRGSEPCCCAGDDVPKTAENFRCMQPQGLNVPPAAEQQGAKHSSAAGRWQLARRALGSLAQASTESSRRCAFQCFGGAITLHYQATNTFRGHAQFMIQARDLNWHCGLRLAAQAQACTCSVPHPCCREVTSRPETAQAASPFMAAPSRTRTSSVCGVLVQLRC